MEIETAIDKWLAYKRRKWTPKVAQYVAMMSRGWKIAWEGWELDQIQSSHVIDWQLARAPGRSTAAGNDEGAYLKQFFKHAVRAGWTKNNPTWAWERRAYVVRKPYLPLSGAEETALLLRVEEQWLRSFIVISICTGLRERTLYEARASWLQNGWLICPAGSVKNGEPHQVPLAKRALRVLEEGQESNSLMLIPGMPRPEIVWRKFKKLAEVAGFKAPLPTPHDLVKTFCWRNKMAGHTLEETMQLRGSKSAGIVMRHYWGPLADQRAKEMVEKL